MNINRIKKRKVICILRVGLNMFYHNLLKKCNKQSSLQSIRKKKEEEEEEERKRKKPDLKRWV